MARKLLLSHLEGLGCPDNIDEAIVEYACDVLQGMIEDETGDDEESFVHLDSLLAGACGEAFETHAETDRLLRLATLVREARCAASAAACPAPETVRAEGSLPSQPRATTLSSSGGESVDTGSENEPPADRVPGPCQPPAVLHELYLLCGEAVSLEFLQYALEQQFHEDAEALAAWLLDSDRAELQGMQAQWERQRQREQQDEEAARLLKERNKQQILQKFDLRPVAQPKDTKKSGKPAAPLDPFVSKTAPQQPKVRYLDGRVVSTKGEKYIIEKTGEEWDGGSRGKVYTKGKRGKGFM